MGSMKQDAGCPVTKNGSHWVTNNGDCITAVLSRNIACRLGLSMNNKPYVVPLTFTFTQDDNAHYIYFHWSSTKDGESKKMRYILNHIEQKRKVCIETDIPGAVLPEVNGSGCDWDLSYASIIGYGKIENVTDKNEKTRILQQKLTLCTHRSEWFISQENFEQVSVWKVTLKNKDTLARYRFLFPPDYAKGKLTPVS
ncbi:MAG: hypothetical protein GY795_06470 [Desulfobacterales bacterium]|nr:hypothetical protein [Desulfobacterales bacterium]